MKKLQLEDRIREKYSTTFYISENGVVVVYYDRHTMEGRGEFNYGEWKTHWHERVGVITKEEIKKSYPNSKIYVLPDTRVSKFHLDKIRQLNWYFEEDAEPIFLYQDKFKKL